MAKTTGARVLLALALLVTCPGLIWAQFRPIDLGEPLAPTILAAVPPDGVLAQLLTYVTDTKLLDFINSYGIPAVVLVPGNGTMAQAILQHLTTLSPANATKLATALVQYHVIPWKTDRPELKLTDLVKELPTLLTGRYTQTLDTISTKLYDAKSKLILAAGVAPGALIDLDAKRLGGGARLYIMDDLLVPPSATLADLYPYSIYNTVAAPTSRAAVAPVAGLAGMAKESAGWSLGSPGEEGMLFVNLTKLVDPQLYSVLSSNSTAYTLWVPSNVALSAYMAKKKVTAAKFPKAVLRRHVFIQRAFLTDTFVNVANLTIPYTTYGQKTAAKGTYLSGTLERNPFAGGMVEQVVYEICPKTTKRATRSRKVQIRRWQVDIGKSVVYYMDQVFDLCE